MDFYEVSRSFMEMIGKLLIYANDICKWYSMPFQEVPAEFLSRPLMETNCMCSMGIACVMETAQCFKAATEKWC